MNILRINSCSILISLIIFHYTNNTSQQKPYSPDTQIKANKPAIFCYMDGNVTESGCHSCFFTVLESKLAI